MSRLTLTVIVTEDADEGIRLSVRRESGHEVASILLPCVDTSGVAGSHVVITDSFNQLGATVARALWSELRRDTRPAKETDP